jgi:uncharacterized membrane protein YfcA
MSWSDIGISAVAILPIQAGMPIGRWLRRRTKPQWFRVAVLVVLALGGVDMLRRAFF